MKVSLVCFTRMGFETMKKIAGTGSAGGNEEKWDTSLWVAGRYALRLAREDAGLPYQAIVEGGLSAWTGAEFQRSDALIFVGACGITVRAIAPFVQDKFHDPAVLCVDEAGTFVIPILSGHVGGANRLAEFVAGGIGAVPVVTTATDVERKFAVDVFAKDHGLVITDRVLAKRISADILAEEPVGVFSDFGFSGWKKIPEGLFRDRLCKRNPDHGVGPGEGRDPVRPCPAPRTEVCGTGDRMQTGNSRGEDPRDGGGRYEAERDRPQKCLCGREYRYQKAGTGDHRFCKYAAGPVSHLFQ